MPTKSPTEQIRDLALEVRALTAREATLQDAVNDLKSNDQKRQGEITELRKELAAAQQETAVLGRQLQDHLKQVEMRDGRRWSRIVALTGVLVGAVMSLASGLVVTLAKK